MKPQDSPEARIADALKLLELLVAPCEGADEHSWRKCRRCAAVHGVEERFPLSIELLKTVARRLHEQAQEIERLNGELQMIDNVMARRPALDQPTRWQNVEKAIGYARRTDDAEKRAEAAESALTAAKQEIAAMSVSLVPPTIATDDDFREVYCQGYRHALSDVVKRLAELTQAKP